MAHGPSFFIVGCSRSGTTLLQHMLDAHPRLAVIPETRWFVRWYEKRYSLAPGGFVTTEMISRLLAKHRLMRDIDLQIPPAELFALCADGRQVHFADFVSHVMGRYGNARGKQLVGNKTPGFVRSLATIHRLWPNAKLVHIIRDGRDVCLSILEKRRKKGKKANPEGRFATWDEDPVSTAALWWEWDVRLGQEAGAKIGPKNYHELRYEALVADAEATSAALCDFLGVPYDDAIVQYYQRREKKSERVIEKHRGLDRPPTVGLRNWRFQMAAPDAERFESAAGALLDELGYPRAYPNPSREATEWAEDLRSRFRGRPLPQRWDGQKLAARPVGTS